MGKAVINLFTSLNGITGNTIADTIIFTIIISISGSFTYYVVGRIFDELDFYNSGFMALAYAIIIVLSFLLLFYITKVIYSLLIIGISLITCIITFVTSIPLWVYLVIGVLVILGSYLFVKYVTS